MLVSSQLHLFRIPTDSAVKYPLPFLVILPQFLIETPVSAHLGFTPSLSSGPRPELVSFRVSSYHEWFQLNKGPTQNR